GKGLAAMSAEEVRAVAGLKSEEVRRGYAMGVAYSPAGKLAIAWVDGLAEIVGERRWRASPTALKAVAWSPDGKSLATAGLWRSRIDRWDAATGKPLGDVTGHGEEPVRLRVLPGGKEAASASGMGELLRWRLASGPPRVVPLPFRRGNPGTPELSPDGTLAAVPETRSGSIALCDGRTGRPLRRLAGSPSPLHRMEFSPDGARLAAMHEDGLRVWDLRTGRLAARRPGKAAYPVALTHSPDGKLLLAAHEDGEATLSDAATGKVLRRRRFGDFLFAAALSPDGRRAAFKIGSRRPGRVVLWDHSADRIERAWLNELGALFVLAFSPDGRLLATGGDERDGRVAAWEVETGRLAATFAGHRGGTTSLAWTPDGRAVLSGGGDSTILRWSLARSGAAPGLERSWQALAKAEGVAAVWELATPAGAALIGRRMEPVPVADAVRIGDLLTGLAAEGFAERVAAERSLARIGPAAETELRKALPGLDIEPKKRVERLLAGWENGAERLRQRRAVWALEQADARRELERLASGARGAWLTEEAKKALDRRKR
ncbi:MAG: hypothetical protein K2W96_23185, partial [Gemmataceae bacterium]|nr:hypothetical protein [Gemmataceae bacterium]